MTRLDQKRVQRTIWRIGFICGALIFGSIGWIAGAEVHGGKPQPPCGTSTGTIGGRP